MYNIAYSMLYLRIINTDEKILICCALHEKRENLDYETADGIYPVGWADFHLEFSNTRK
jgi:hypothetical protein